MLYSISVPERTYGESLLRGDRRFGGATLKNGFEKQREKMRASGLFSNGVNKQGWRGRGGGRLSWLLMYEVGHETKDGRSKYRALLPRPVVCEARGASDSPSQLRRPMLTPCERGPVG